MKPLAVDMTQLDPAKRPDIHEVMKRLRDIIKSMSSWKLRSRVVNRKEWFIVGVWRFLPYAARTAGSVVTRKAAIPLP